MKKISENKLVTINGGEYQYSPAECMLAGAAFTGLIGLVNPVSIAAALALLPILDACWNS